MMNHYKRIEFIEKCTIYLATVKRDWSRDKRFLPEGLLNQDKK